MKKKILGGTALLAIVAVAAMNVSLGTKSSNLSEASLANVEALAQGEWGYNCYYNPSYPWMPCASWSPGDNCPCGA